MKKTLAVLLTITSPIWILPVAVVLVFCMMFSEMYENMLELVETIRKHFEDKE